MYPMGKPYSNVYRIYRVTNLYTNSTDVTQLHVRLALPAPKRKTLLVAIKDHAPLR